MMVERISQIQQRIAPIRAALLNHPIYREIDQLAALRVFMEHHVFAVWDFMSLLKSLQQRLCASSVPWLPPVDSLGVRLINEIVLAEESDEDGHGRFASHYDLYLQAMRQCGASTAAIEHLLKNLREGLPIFAALEEGRLPDCVRQFVRHTFMVIKGGDLCETAATFTFGREDLLPAVFQRIVERLNEENDGKLEEFKYYLRRHIDLDGDEHGPMANQLLVSLCGDDSAKWNVAEEAAVASLQARLTFWDGIEKAITTFEAMRGT